MSNSTAAQAKADGSAAWSSGNYALAVEHFTKAINIGGDKEFLKVLYSNRSAAYLKLNKITEALRDGNKCVELDSNWVKGYARKGDALLASKQYTEAYNAYNSGARIDPTDATLKEKCEQAMRAIRNAADATNNASRRTNTSTGSSGPAPIYVQYVQVAILVLTVLYALPIFGDRYRTISHKLCVGLFAGLTVYNIYLKYGFPQFTAEWAQRLVPDPLAMHLFLSFVLLMNRPYLLSMGPIIIGALMTFTERLMRGLREQYPAVQASLQPLLARFAPGMANADLGQLLRPQMAQEIDRQLLKMAATIEAYHGVYLIFELLLPSRNLMQLYIWWQYLRLRYMVDTTGNLKAAFHGLDQRIQTLLAMRMCPDAVRKGYAMLQTYLAKQVEIPTADSSQSSSSGGSGGGFAGGLRSAMSKCTVM